MPSTCRGRFPELSELAGASAGAGVGAETPVSEGGGLEVTAAGAGAA